MKLIIRLEGNDFKLDGLHHYVLQPHAQTGLLADAVSFSEHWSSENYTDNPDFYTFEDADGNVIFSAYGNGIYHYRIGCGGHFFDFEVERGAQRLFKVKQS